MINLAGLSEVDEWQYHLLRSSPHPAAAKISATSLSRQLEGLSDMYARGSYTEEERARIQMSMLPADLRMAKQQADVETSRCVGLLIQVLQEKPELVTLLAWRLRASLLLPERPVAVLESSVLPFLIDLRSRLFHGKYIPGAVQQCLQALLNGFITFGLSEAVLTQRDQTARAHSNVSQPTRVRSWAQIDDTSTREAVLTAYWEQTRAMVGETLDPTSCVWGMSDLHTDCPENMHWLEELPVCLHDTVIVAGDIATQLCDIEHTLTLLQSK